MFLCDENYKIKNCELLQKLKKFAKKNKNKIKNKDDKYVNKHKQRAYNVEKFSTNDNNNFELFDIDSNNEKNMKEIVVLFKKLIKIFFKFD